MNILHTRLLLKLKKLIDQYESRETVSYYKNNPVSFWIRCIVYNNVVSASLVAIWRIVEAQAVGAAAVWS